MVILENSESTGPQWVNTPHRHPRLYLPDNNSVSSQLMFGHWFGARALSVAMITLALNEPPAMNSMLEVGGFRCLVAPPTFIIPVAQF